jgi:DNA-binding FadR family transcriptional regulator
LACSIGSNRARQRRIVDAIAQRGDEAAAEATRAHLTRANELYRTLSKQ